MKQPSRKDGRSGLPRKKALKPSGRWKHPKFGTSKLEEDFARDFLEKLGVKYIYQFEAKDIGRWFDFYLPEHNLLVEIDGSYFHSDPRVVKESEMNPMQKRNRRVDEHKNKWALLHGIPLIRIWEKDIRENPSGVLSELRRILGIQQKRKELLDGKNRRHRNIIK